MTFPDKWCVKGPLNKELLNFFNNSVKGENRNYSSEVGSFFHYPAFNYKGSICVTGHIIENSYTLVQIGTANIIVELIKQGKL